MFHREIIINYGELDTAKDALAYYIQALIRVSSDKFDELINQYFKIPNPGSAKERTMLHAIQTGKIQSGEAKLKALRLQLQNIFGMDVDISVIKIGGPFDNPPFIPFE